MSKAIEVTGQTINTVLDSNDVVLLDFWAAWCGPCRMFAPIFERSAEKHTDVVFGKIDTKKEQRLAGEFQIRSIPTLMVFRQGILVFEQAGLLPEAALDELIGKVKALDMTQVRKEIEAAEAQR